MEFRRLETALGKAVRFGILANIALTLLFAVAVIFRETWSVAVADSSVNAARAERIARVEPISKERVMTATSGRAVFRTYRAAEEKVVDELGRYRLSGISFRDGQRRAFIKDTKQNRSFSVGAGDVLGVFQVIAVEKDAVRLQRGGDEVLLKRR